jgi:hypothetical protein
MLKNWTGMEFANRKKVQSDPSQTGVRTKCHTQLEESGMLREFIVILLILMGTGAVLAQEAQQPAEKTAIDSLRAEVVALRQVVARMAPAETQQAAKQEPVKKDSVIQQVRRDVDAIMKESKSGVKLSGVIYTYYQFTTYGVDGNNFNKFDLDRVYLTAKANLTDNTRLQFTTDVYRQTDTSKNAFYPGVAIRVKFAYAEYLPASDFAVRIGMIPTHWQGFVDGLWKYRVLIANITDNTRAGYTASADLGASATYTLPSKLGEVFFGIYNGAGYSSPEANRFKDFAVRATLTPLASQPLTVAAYYYKGGNESKIKQYLGKDRWGALISYAYQGVTVGVDYNEKRDQGKPSNITLEDTIQTGKAISFFGEAKSPFEGFLGSLALLWRLDYIDANSTVGRDIGRYSIVGISWKASDKLTFILDRQTNNVEPGILLTRVDKVKIDYDNKWFLHAQLNF